MAEPEILERLTSIATNRLGTPPERLDVDAPLDRLFNDHELPQFYEEGRKEAGIGPFTFEELLDAIQRPVVPIAFMSTIHALQLLTPFYRGAGYALKEMSWRTERPTLKSFAETLRSREPILSPHKGEEVYPPYGKRGALFVLFGLLVGYPFLGFVCLLVVPCDPTSFSLETQLELALALAALLSAMSIAVLLVMVALAFFRIRRHREQRSVRTG